MVTKYFSKGKVENVSSGVVVSQRSSSILDGESVTSSARCNRRIYLVVGTSDFIANLELTFLHVTDVQNITVVYLNVGNLKVCFAVDGDGTSVILLTSRLGVKVRLVKQ